MGGTWLLRAISNDTVPESCLKRIFNPENKIQQHTQTYHQRFKPIKLNYV